MVFIDFHTMEKKMEVRGTIKCLVGSHGSSQPLVNDLRKHTHTQVLQSKGSKTSTCQQAHKICFEPFLPGSTKEIQHTWRSILFLPQQPTPQQEALVPLWGVIVRYVRVDLCGALTPAILLFQWLEMVMNPSVSVMQSSLPEELLQENQKSLACSTSFRIDQFVLHNLLVVY